MFPSPRTPSAEELLQHMGFIRTLALELAKDPSLADDVAQDTLIDAMKRPPVLRGGLRAWLGGVVRNKVRTHHRGETRRSRWEKAAGEFHGQCGAEAELAGNALQRTELRQRVVQAVIDLPEPYRLTITLRYLEELSPTEIAEWTEVPLSTVKTRLQRGLVRLREKLEEEHGEGTSLRASLLLLASPSILRPAKVASVGAAVPLVVGLLVALPVVGYFGWSAWVDRSAPPEVTTVNSIGDTLPIQDEGRDSPEFARSVPILTEEPRPNSGSVGTGVALLVVDEAGNPVESVAVVSESSSQVSTRTDHEGRAELPLRLNEMSLVRLTHPGYVPRVVLFDDAEQKTVVLHVGTLVKVRVRDAETAQPIANAIVSVCQAQSVLGTSDGESREVEELLASDLGELKSLVGGKLGLVSDSTVHCFCPLYPEMRTNHSGEVAVRVEPGTSLHVCARVEGYTQGFWLGDAELNLVTLDLEQGAQLTVVRDGAFDGQPIALFVAGPTPQCVQMNAGQEQIILTGLAAGSYRVTACEGGLHELKESPLFTLGSPSCFDLDLRVNAYSEMGELAGRTCMRTIEIDDSDARLSLAADGVDARIRLSGLDLTRRPEVTVALYLEHQLVGVAQWRGIEARLQSVSPGAYDLEVRDGSRLLHREQVTIRIDEPSLDVRIPGSTLGIALDLQAGDSPVRCVVVHRKSGTSRTSEALEGVELLIEGLEPGLTDVWICRDRDLLRESIELRDGHNSLRIGRRQGPHELEVVVLDELGRGLPASAWVVPILSIHQSRSAELLLGSSSVDLKAAAAGRVLAGDASWTVSSGRYRVAIDAEGYFPYHGEIEVSTSERIELVLPTPLEVSLELHRDGDPEAKSKLIVQQLDAPRLAGIPPTAWARTDHDGLALLSLPAGRYSVSTPSRELGTIQVSPECNSFDIDVARDSGDAVAPISSPSRPDRSPR